MQITYYMSQSRVIATPCMSGALMSDLVQGSVVHEELRKGVLALWGLGQIDLGAYSFNDEPLSLYSLLISPPGHWAMCKYHTHSYV